MNCSPVHIIVPVIHKILVNVTYESRPEERDNVIHKSYQIWTLLE